MALRIDKFTPLVLIPCCWRTRPLCLCRANSSYIHICAYRPRAAAGSGDACGLGAPRGSPSTGDIFYPLQKCILTRGFLSSWIKFISSAPSCTRDVRYRCSRHEALYCRRHGVGRPSCGQRWRSGSSVRGLRQQQRLRFFVPRLRRKMQVLPQRVLSPTIASNTSTTASATSFQVLRLPLQSYMQQRADMPTRCALSTGLFISNFLPAARRLPTRVCFVLCGAEAIRMH